MQSFDEIALKEKLKEVEETMSNTLNQLLPHSDGREGRLYTAMRYTALSGGKFLRPFLLIMAADMFQVDRAFSLRAAAAIEMVHSYSLIHDDLPAMDDDAVRRGKPSCHIAFDEATAILAGDALLTHAFAIVADAATHPKAEVRCALVAALAHAAGPYGMVAGQMLDIDATAHASYDELQRVHYLKTAKMFAACAEMAAILGEVSHEQKAMIQRFAVKFGLAFQLCDDIADWKQDEGHASPTGSSNVALFFNSQMAEEMLQKNLIEAKESLAIFGQAAHMLQASCDYFIPSEGVCHVPTIG